MKTKMLTTLTQSKFKLDDCSKNIALKPTNWKSYSEHAGAYAGLIKTVQIMQKSLSFILLIVLLTIFCPKVLAKMDLIWVISPQKGQFGPININTSEADLVRIYGKSNVRRDTIGIGDDIRPGTIVFPNDPKKEIGIFWKNQSKFQNPAMIFITTANNTRYNKNTKCLWRTEHGVTIGTTLKELEQINAGPFELSGIPTDACFGGNIFSWQNGKLQKELSAPLSVSLLLSYNKACVKLTPAEQRNIKQDNKHFSSADPVMQKINPSVYCLVAEFK